MSAYLARLAEQGKALLVKHRDALEKIERELGVPPPGRARHLGARDRLRRAPLAALRHPGAGHPGLARPAQGDVPQRADLRPQDAAGRRAHARDHERVVGRRHGPHAVHAVGVLHAGLRPRRRRPQGHLGLGAGRAGLRRQPAARQGLGGRATLGLRGAPAGRHHLPARGAAPRAHRARVGEARGRAHRAGGRFPPRRSTPRPSF